MTTTRSLNAKNPGCDGIDATFEKAGSLGGEILMPKTEIPHVGWRSFLLIRQGIGLRCIREWDTNY